MSQQQSLPFDPLASSVLSIDTVS